jgi:hypothetical protein
VERLEDRVVPDSGGAAGVLTSVGNMQLNPTGQATGGFPQVIPNVKIQLIFLSDPQNHTSIPAATQTAIKNFFTAITADGYISKLLAQYGNTLGLPAIGNGSVGVVDTKASVAPDTTVTVGGTTYPAYSDNFDSGDHQLQDIIQAEINNGNSAPPDGLDNLYVLFTPPGDAVVDGDASNSVQDFHGYHTAFLDSDGTHEDYYAVIPDESRVNGNDSLFGLNALQGETEVASHEMAEAITDAIPVTGWVDPSASPLAEGEVADQAANETYVQDGHQVQYLWSNALAGPAHAPGSGAADLFINQVTPPAVPVGTSTSVPVATFTAANTSLTASNFSATVFNFDSTGHGSVNWTVTSITGGNGHFVINARPNTAVAAGTYGKLFSQQEGLYVIVQDTSAADAGKSDGGAPTSDRYAPYIVATAAPLTYTADSGSGVHTFVLKENAATGNFELRDNGLLVFTQPIASTSGIVINADPAVPGQASASVDNSLTIDYSGGKFTTPVTFDGGPGGGTHTLTVTGGSFTNETYTYTGAAAGSVTLDGQVVTFSHTTALADSDTVVNDTFNLPNAGNTVTFQESGNGGTPLQLVSSGTFPTTQFASPTSSLAIAWASGSANTITVKALPDLHSALAINGNGSTDTVNLTGALTLGKAGNTGSLSVTAKVISITGTVDTTAGTAGTVALTAGQSITLPAGAGIKTRSGTGSVTLTADVIDLAPNGANPSITSGGASQFFFAPNSVSRPVVLGGSDSAGSLVYTDADNAAIAQGGASGFGTITIGGPGGSGAVTTAANVTFGANVTVQTPKNTTGGIAVRNALDAGTNSLALVSGTTVLTSGPGALKAGTLALTAGGSIGSSTTPLAINAGTLTADSHTGNGNQFLSDAATAKVTAVNGLNAGTGTITLAGGTFLIDGSTASSSPVVVDGGATLGGAGTVGGAVTVNSGGTVSPGDSGPGALATGGLTVKTGGTFRVAMAGKAVGSGYDQLNVRGTATLGGTISVSLLNGFQPSAGESYQVLTFTSRSGDFTTQTGFNLGGGLALQEQFSPGGTPTGLNLVVNAAAGASHFGMTASAAAAVAGTAVSVTVTALDASGNVATGYTGTVHFSSSDAQAALPPAYTFTAADAGVHTYSVTFNTAGSQSLSVADGGTPPLSGSTNVTVQSASSGLSESFDTTAVGALPTGWAQWSSTGQAAFAATSAQSLSPPNGLGMNAPSSSLAARAWVAAPQPADVQVSASVYLNTLIPAQVLARGSNLNGSTPSYYAVAISRGLQVQLLRVVNGVTTTLATLSPAGYVSSVWVRVTLSVVGTQLQAQVYRVDKQQYLTAAGAWQSAPAWALSATDAMLSGPGLVGLARQASYPGTVVFDDFATAAAGSQP